MNASVKRVVTALALLIPAALFLGGINPSNRNAVQKTEIIEYKNLDVNNLSCIIGSDGPYGDSNKNNAAGMEWPKGSGKTCMYTAGLWIAGIHRPSGQIRCAMQDYQSEEQPGPMLPGEIYNTSTNDDAVWTSRAGDPNYRLYKVKNNKPLGDPSVQADPWSAWPTGLGAPYIDANGNGVYDPQYDANGNWVKGSDQPKFYGDEMVWCVINDCSVSRHHSTSTSLPMGLEIQELFFAFNQPGALGNMMFMRWKLINKSDADYDNVYVGEWSDIDLGDANDDEPACDTTLGLGYVWNFTNNDATYGTAPPADGLDFFQGPKVPGLPTDSALVDGKWIKGFKNVKQSGFVAYINAAGDFSDPTLGASSFPAVAYAYLQGKEGWSGQYQNSPTTGQPITYWLSGDPITKSGDIYTNFGTGTPFASGRDIRIMNDCGSFTLAKGDTQEIVGAFIINRGSSNLNSITALKSYTAVSLQAFKDNFVVAGAPPVPTVAVTVLPNEAVLDWTEGSDVTESYNFRHNEFEGYNLYQGTSTSGPWTRLATYDRIDSVTLIVDQVKDPVTGNYYPAPVQFGTDSGLRHYFIIDHDFLSGGPLVNGRNYYFSLTTYSYYFGNPDSLIGPVSLEANPDPIIITPRDPSIGTVIPAVGTVVLGSNRPHDDAAYAQIVDPGLLTGYSYLMTFNGVDTAVNSWNLIRMSPTKTDTPVIGNLDFAADAISPYVDGVSFRVTNPAPGVRTDAQTPDGWSYTPSANQWFQGAGIGLQAMANGLGYPVAGVDRGTMLGSAGSGIKPDSLRKIEIHFSTTQTQHAYRYLGNVKSLPLIPPAKPSFVPWIKVRGPGLVYQGDYDSVNVPFTVWDVDQLSGGPVPRQLNVGIFEYNDTLGNIDGQWDPTNGANGGNEVIVIFKSTYADTAKLLYTRNPSNPAQPINFFSQMNKIDVMYFVWLRAVTPVSTFKNGDVLTVVPNYALNASRQYALVVPKVTSGNTALMKDQMSLINVFPNPYFAHNKAEYSPYIRWVTFSHLPQVATIRIFAISGEQVRVIYHNDNSTFQQWDLRNENGLPVASGIYIAYIEVPGAGNKILKLAIIQPEERPTRI